MSVKESSFKKVWQWMEGILYLLLLTTTPFIAAGEIKWIMPWVYLGTYIAVMFIGSALVAQKDSG